jgi:hypothetical protein
MPLRQFFDWATQPVGDKEMSAMKYLVRLGLALALVIVLSYTFMIRPWHVSWGATQEEQTLSLPGDALMGDPVTVSTRAITIHAPAATVWRWLIQIGQDRGGWYSYTWFENLFAARMHNVARIVPELQELKVGDPVLFAQIGLHTNVALLEPERSLVLSKGWSFTLTPLDEQTTRLIVRYPCQDNPIYFYALLEPAHFIMESGMMLGLKQRAEATP